MINVDSITTGSISTVTGSSIIISDDIRSNLSIEQRLDRLYEAVIKLAEVVQDLQEKVK